MSKPANHPVDLLLEANWKPSAMAARPMALLDAPKVEPETHPSGFNWTPIFIGIMAMLVLLAAVAYL